MPRFYHADIQAAAEWDSRTLMREINSRFDTLTRVINENRAQTQNVNNTIMEKNSAHPAGFTFEGYRLVHLATISTIAGCTVAITIDGVAVTGSPFNSGLALEEFDVASANETNLDSVSTIQMTPTGLGGSDTMLVGHVWERIN